ncbi:MAG: DISARM system helicase DrmA [Syntrophales bacterium]
MEGDGVLIAGGDPLVAVAVARIYRIRAKLDKTTFFFDGVLQIDGNKCLAELGVTMSESNAAMRRLEWPVFASVLKTACGIDFNALPVLSGESVEEQAYVRELLQLAVIDDILGPADGPVEEIVGMSVRDRYLVGKLAPMSPSGRQSEVPPFAEEDVPDGNVPADLTPYVNDDHISRDKVPSSAVDDDEEKEINASENQSLVPSSMGFTFCVDGELADVQLFASWGRYERTESEQIDEKTGKPKRCWKRIPSGGSAVVSLKRRTIDPIRVDADCPSVVVQGSVSAPLKNGDRLVTLFLINTQILPEQNQDQAWIFQPELSVRDLEGRGVFRRRPILRSDEFDDEREALEMIYRDRVEFAVGHGVSVHATASANDAERAVEVRTAVLPEYEIQVTETPGLEPEDRPAMRRMMDEGLLDMERLAELEREKLVVGLKVLTEDYAIWISEGRDLIGSGTFGYDTTGTEAMNRCALVLERLKEGIDVLATDDRALAAFRFANQAMASQRIHSIYALGKRRGDGVTIEALNKREHRSWRPFQLAFILLSIPAIADPTHQDRTQPLEAFADLLWFPTGGGKTEAYLGVAAFTMGIRRLQGDMGGLDSGRGLAVIMRYTLRLLTLQQFQRATSLICAMEVLRRAEPSVWGKEPFTIGLWVGQKVTPNTTEESHAAIASARDGQRQRSSSPAQLTFCPWCGSDIQETRDIEVKQYKSDVGKTIIYCGDIHKCEFRKAASNGFGLPVVVVDEEIYRHPPSMLIATVDKFAMMAWRGQVRTLFGKADQECLRHGLLWPDADCKGNHNAKGNLPRVSVKNISLIRPPDLIIQDEFHLISGPLGTMVGLYETAVDELSTWTMDGKTIRPKVIASTATVRKAEEQVNNVFLRKVSVFPPHGLNVEDNFFSVQRTVEDKPGRFYMGICSPGSSRPAVLIRVYVALLTGAQALFERFGAAADPYMTVVGYFNSLRELGGMRRLAEDDVQTRAYRVKMSDVKRPGLSQRSVRIVDELTSRVSNKEIPKKLDQLEVKFKPTWEKGETRAIDIVLATNMLSVGVDVNRIGLMVVNGQPKNTAEYIQATSRIGRFFPGLVCTVLTWSRPRDLSHYETFEHYHATFYKHVEAQSVTPFAARALDRGLTGVMVSLLRLENDSMNPNAGAQSLDSSGKSEALRARKVLSERAWKVKDKAARTTADNMAADRIDRWVKESVKAGRRLGYETERGQGDLASLLKKPGALAWEEFTVPMSMREVEPGVQLIMDAAKHSSESPSWKPKLKKSNGGEA